MQDAGPGARSANHPATRVRRTRLGPALRLGALHAGEDLAIAFAPPLQRFAHHLGTAAAGIGAIEVDIAKKVRIDPDRHPRPFASSWPAAFFLWPVNLHHNLCVPTNAERRKGPASRRS